MATHITCYNSDILPNSFPPPRPTAREYSNFMASEYQASSIMNTINPQQTYDRGRELLNDEIPVLSNPMPTITTSTRRSHLTSDPTLTVTPEKKSPVQSKSRMHQQRAPYLDDDLTLTPEPSPYGKGRTSLFQNTSDSTREDSSMLSSVQSSFTNTKEYLGSSRTVRFDQNIEVRQLSPQSSVLGSSPSVSDPRLDLNPAPAPNPVDRPSAAPLAAPGSRSSAAPLAAPASRPFAATQDTSLNSTSDDGSMTGLKSYYSLPGSVNTDTDRDTTNTTLTSMDSFTESLPRGYLNAHIHVNKTPATNSVQYSRDTKIADSQGSLGQTQQYYDHTRTAMNQEQSRKLPTIYPTHHSLEQQSRKLPTEYSTEQQKYRKTQQQSNTVITDYPTSDYLISDKNNQIITTGRINHQQSKKNRGDISSSKSGNIYSGSLSSNSFSSSDTSGLDSLSSQGSSVEPESLEPIEIVASDLRPDLTTSSSRSKRGHREFVTSGSGVTESVLARPEFSSSLRVRKEMTALKETDVDLVKAVKNKLKTSDKAKTKVNEKAFSQVNQEDFRFTELPGLEVRQEDAILIAEENIRSKAKPPVIVRGKPESRLQKPPDIMELFTRKLERETASYTTPGVPAFSNKPQTAHVNAAFDVYRHIRAWEKW